MASPSLSLSLTWGAFSSFFGGLCFGGLLHHSFCLGGDARAEDEISFGPDSILLDFCCF